MLAPDAKRDVPEAWRLAAKLDSLYQSRPDSIRRYQASYARILVGGAIGKKVGGAPSPLVDSARRVLDRALTFATSRQTMVPFALAYITQARALLHLAEGQLDDALALARKAIEFGVQSRFRLELGAAQRVLGQVLEASGDREQAGEALSQSLETFEEIQSLPELGQTLLAYGRFKLGDDAAEGQRLITRARGIFARIGAVGWVAEADTALGPR